MGRIRTIKPEFFSNETLSGLNPETHILAAGLLCYSDDFGYFNPHPALIRAAVFPLRETLLKMQEMMIELSRVGYIRIGKTPEGKSIGQVCKFSDHQRVNRPTKSKYGDISIVWESSVNPHGVITEPSHTEGKGKEQGIGKELKPSRDKREVDPRHIVFKSEIEAYALAKKVQFVWDVSEAAQLGLLLKAAPGLTFENFKKCLMHRARSPGTPHGERPRAWLPNILKYQEAPLNEFGKTGDRNGTFKGKSGQSVDAAKRAIQEIEDSYTLDGPGNSETGEVGCGGLPTLRLGS